MPVSIEEEMEKIQRRSVGGDFLTANAELDELLKSDNLTLEEELYIKIFKSEVISMLSSIGHDQYSLKEGLGLAEYAAKHIDDIQDEYLRTGILMALAMNYMNTNMWKEMFETYEKLGDSFLKLKLIDSIFYLRLKAFQYLKDSMIPFLKTYINEKSTDEEKARAFQLLLECEEYCEKNKLVSYHIAVLYNIGSLQYWMGNLDECLKTRIKTTNIARNTGNKLYYAYTLSHLAGVYYSLNDFRKYYDLQKERLVIVEELGIRSMIASNHRSIGAYFVIIGEYDEAISHYDKSIKIFEEQDRKKGVAFVQKDLGYVYYLKGDFENALKYYDKAFLILEKNKPQTWRFILSDLAALYIQTGDFDKALEYLDQLLPLHEGLNDKHGISTVLSDQGLIYWQKGLKEKGLQLIKKSLEMRRKLGDKGREANSLSYLIQFYIEMKNIEQAKKYFEELTEINKEIDNKSIKQAHKFSEALLLKASTNNRDRIKAEVLFEQLIDEETIYPILTQVLLNLCELFLIDIKETNNEESLEKLSINVNKLQELAEKNKSNILLVETLEFQAQLALIEFDIDSAKNLLLKAQTVAQEKGLDEKVLNLLKQQEELTKQSLEIKKLEHTDSPISSRVSLVKLDKTVDRMKNTSLSKSVSSEEVSKKLLSIQI